MHGEAVLRKESSSLHPFIQSKQAHQSIAAVDRIAATWPAAEAAAAIGHAAAAAARAQEVRRARATELRRRSGLD